MFKIFNDKKEWIGSLVWVTLISLIFLPTGFGLRVFYNDWKWLYWGTWEEFREWYPRFFLPAFLIIKSLPLIVGLVIFWFWNTIRKSKLWKIVKTNLKYGLYFPADSYSETLFSFYKKALLILIIILLRYWSLPASDPTNYESTLLQMYLARLFLFLLLAMALIIYARNAAAIHKGLFQFLTKPSLPYNLAIFRILFFGYLLALKVIENYDKYGTGGAEVLNASNIVPLPYMEWYINLIDLSPEIYRYFCLAAIILSIFIALGLFTRIALLLMIPVIFITIGTPHFYGKLIHNHIFIWIPWLLAFSPCFHVFSLDSLFRKWRGKPYIIQKNTAYTFPLKFIWLQLGIIYLPSGVIKLWDCGFDWALGDSMLNQMYLQWVEFYDQVPAIRIDHFPNFVKFGGLVVILFEMSFLPLLFLRWGRWFVSVGGVLMHLMISVFMYIYFMQLAFMYIVFIDWNKLKFFQKKEAGKVGISFSKISSFHKIGFYFGVILVSLNLFCGLFKIHSVPFSSYPTYSAIVPSTVEYLYMEGVKNDAIIVFDDIGKINGYFKETYLVFEQRILEKRRLNQSWESELNNYIKI